MKKVREIITIVVPTFIVFAILVFLFYVHTDIGFSETINGYMPMYAPAWMEALVTTLFIPFMVGFSIYDHYYPVDTY